MPPPNLLGTTHYGYRIETTSAVSLAIFQTDSISNNCRIVRDANIDTKRCERGGEARNQRTKKKWEQTHPQDISCIIRRYPPGYFTQSQTQELILGRQRISSPRLIPRYNSTTHPIPALMHEVPYQGPHNQRKDGHDGSAATLQMNRIPFFWQFDARNNRCVK